MTNRCSGGHVYENDLSYLSYPCGASCRGSLLIDCCTKCTMYEQSPESLGVSGVDCAGCEPYQLAKAANQADCTFNGVQFKCKSADRCHLGKPSLCTSRETSNSKLVCKGCARAPFSSSSSPTLGLIVVLLMCCIPVFVVAWCVFSRIGRRKNQYGSEIEASDPQEIPEGQSSAAYTAE